MGLEDGRRGIGVALHPERHALLAEWPLELSLLAVAVAAAASAAATFRASRDASRLRFV